MNENVKHEATNGENVELEEKALEQVAGGKQTADIGRGAEACVGDAAQQTLGKKGGLKRITRVRL